MKKVNINTIRMNKNNPRIIRDEKYRKLLKSIQEFPEMLEKRPLVCETALDGKYVVLGGNMRLKACNEAGMEMIPIELADDWSTEQKRQFIVKDNVGYGDWDFSLLSSEYELQELEEWGLDMPENIFEENAEPENLTEEMKNNPPVIKITFPSNNDLLQCENEIKIILNKICPKAFYSVSSGEL